MFYTETDKFRKALEYFIKKRGRGIQLKIGQKTGINPVYLNHIIKGRKPGSEEVREKIASFFGLSYENFLALGAWLLEGKNPDEWFMQKALEKDDGVSIPPMISRIVGLLMDMEEEDLESVYRYTKDKTTLRRLEKKVRERGVK